MKLRVQAGSVLKNNPVLLEGVTSLVVLDDENEPLVVAVEQVGKQIIYSSATEDDFLSLLASLGIDTSKLSRMEVIDLKE